MERFGTLVTCLAICAGRMLNELVVEQFYGAKLCTPNNTKVWKMKNKKKTYKILVKH